MIFEVPNFLDDETCDSLVNYFKKSKERCEWQSDSFFSGRTLCPSEIDDVSIKKAMEIFKCKSIQTISKLFFENYIFLEFWDLVHWPSGMEMGPHADNIDQDRTPSFPQRSYSSVCYLNHDYEGGHTFFLYENKGCIPEKGKIIFYPSGIQFTHGVSQVTSGDRYTLASWYTRDKDHVFLDCNLNYKYNTYSEPQQFKV